MDGYILVDKPAGWTSFDVVAKIRATLSPEYKGPGKRLKVGHSGSLDPFATGLLIVLVGKATKRQDEFMGLDKTYEFTIRLGQTSSTGDPEGEIKEVESKKSKSLSADRRIKRHEVEEALKSYTGEIEQTPPAHSAIKVNGQRAYKLARQGKAAEMPTRTVMVHSLELVDYAYPEISCVAKVSKGTYIRSLAADIGSELGLGGYCSQLRRTRIGEHSVENAKLNGDNLSDPLPTLMTTGTVVRQ